MLPIILDGSMIRAGVAGAGAGLQRRLTVLKAGGVEDPVIVSTPVPQGNELAGLQILFIAGLDMAVSRRIATAGRAAGALVNVEDVPELCDFHVPAQVRRGEFLLAISTAGRSPALSRAVREHLEGRFGPEWEGRLVEISDLRQEWRAAGVAPDEVSARTRNFLAERGWLA